MLKSNHKREVDALVRNGQIKQEEITEALVDFYRKYYPEVAEETIGELLQEGL